MKKLLLILSLAIATNGIAQIEIKKEDSERKTVGEVRDVNRFIAQLTYKLYDGDTSYLILYNNAKYETLNDVQKLSFRAEGNTFNTLYNILKSFFAEENKNNKDYQMRFKLGDQDVDVRKTIDQVMVWTSDGYFLLTEKQVDKLFGK